MTIYDEIERAQRELGDRQEYGIYDHTDVLEHCYEHAAYAELQSRALSGERSDWIRNALELIWNWSAACIACRALGVDPAGSSLVRASAERIEEEMAMGGCQVKEAA